MKNGLEAIKNDLLFLLTKNEFYFFNLLCSKEVYESKFPLNLSFFSNYLQKILAKNE